MIEPRTGGIREASRKRGTGFPVLSLRDASDMVKEAGKYGFEHSRDAIAAYLGHRSSNSGPFKQKLASLRDWNLLITSGDRLVLSDVGKRIALPTSEADEADALEQAFRSCEVFAKVYESSAKGAPLSLETIANTAVQNLGISPSSRNEFVQSIRDSAIAARLAESTGDGKIRFLAVAARDDSSSSKGRDLVGMKKEGLDGASPSRSASGSAPGIRQSWPFTGGEVVFEVSSDRAFPPETYRQVGAVVSELEKLVSLLAAGSEEEQDAAD